MCSRLRTQAYHRERAFAEWCARVCHPALIISPRQTRRRRPASGTANPRGGSDPYLSSNNENILDIRFESLLRLDGKESCSYEDIADAIEGISGVVAHGLVLKEHVTAVVHTPEGAQILRKVCANPTSSFQDSLALSPQKMNMSMQPPLHALPRRSNARSFTSLLALAPKYGNFQCTYLRWQPAARGHRACTDLSTIRFAAGIAGGPHAGSPEKLVDYLSCASDWLFVFAECISRCLCGLVSSQRHRLRGSTPEKAGTF